MDTSRFLNHPLFKECLRNFRASAPLFHQGDVGRTMFIVIKGRVQLLGSSNGKPYTVAMIEEGDFLGERALVNELPYERAFSAIAVTDVSAIEIGASEVGLLERQAPYLLKMLLKRSFEITENRLTRANRLVGFLRSSDNEERLLNCVLYFAEVTGRTEIDGVHIAGLAESLGTLIDMDPLTIAQRLQGLVDKALLIAGLNGEFTIPSLPRLIKYATALKKELRAA